MPYAMTNGITMYYEVRGQGQAVLLVGGLGADGHLWYKQVPALAKRFHVITPDNRDAGRTDAPDEPYSMRTMADDLAALLDGLNVPAVHLIGASMGGGIAQEFALAYPDRVRKMVLCCTSFGGPHSVPTPQETVAVLQSRTGDAAHDLRAFLQLQFGTDYPETHARDIDAYVTWRVAHPQPLPAYQRQLAAVVGHDTEARLGQLHMPVLILHGGRDHVVPAGNADLMAARIAGAKVHIFSNAGHLFLWECADEANRIVMEFIRSKEG
jgi:pimeloyl-ACP methyl ester carboxylesterase